MKVFLILVALFGKTLFSKTDFPIDYCNY